MQFVMSADVARLPSHETQKLVLKYGMTYQTKYRMS